jgi:hypothetical protein
MHAGLLPSRSGGGKRAARRRVWPRFPKESFCCFSQKEALFFLQKKNMKML